jgi:hypothetical protein
MKSSTVTWCKVMLKLRVHLKPSKYPRVTPVTEILSPSLGTRTCIGIFGSAAATNCASPGGEGVFSSRAFFFQSLV